VVLKDNGGQTSAMNAGFERTTGDFVVFLDADDRLRPDALERIAAVADASISKSHWSAQMLNAAGETRGVRVPPGPRPRGDLREEVRSEGTSYAVSPTSANAWNRSFLRELFPLEELERAQGLGSAHADAFLSDASHLYGLIEAIDEPLTDYRVHGANDYSSLDLRAKAERDLWLADERFRRLEILFEALGEAVDVHSWRERSWPHRMNAAAELINRAVPEASSFVLIDHDSLPAVWGSRRRHYLIEKDGVDHGLPRDGAHAVRQLSARVASGATRIVLLSAADWMLEAYPDMAAYLTATSDLVAEGPDVRIYSVRQ
jgi:glycosyltransferase involved in cell wall biosynthesis